MICKLPCLNLLTYCSKTLNERFKSIDNESNIFLPFQGYLQKRSSSSINKEWKKKYATLLEGGLLVYYPNLHVSLVHLHFDVKVYGVCLSLYSLTVKLN